MSKFRRAARIDKNQNEIVEALRATPGVTVELGHDDILVGYEGRTYWVEIKSGPKARIKPSQEKLLAEWKGQYNICWELDQILYLIGVKQPECKTCYEWENSPKCVRDHAAENGYS